MPVRSRKKDVPPTPDRGASSGSDDEGFSAPESAPPPAAAPKKGSDLLMRTIFTFILSYVFLMTMYVGQTPGFVLVFVCQALMFKEIMSISQKKAIEDQLPGFFLIPWFMFCVTSLWTIVYHLEIPLVTSFPWMQDYVRHSSFTAFVLYMLGFMAFVLSLKPTMPNMLGAISKKFARKPPSANTPPRQIIFRYQFGQFAWLHMGLFAFAILGSLFYSNMMQGMIWFTLPASCIIHNDSWAYACGKLFGSVPLIPTLSPKKTWEGFIGAWFFTSVWAFWVAGFLASQKRFICPKSNFLTPIDCEVADVYLPRNYDLPQVVLPYLEEYFGYAETFVTVRPVQLHGLAFATFSSLFAPFGGFFASGLKRAFNLKDFGDLIPGHGGVIDRMDCQILMALFVHVYVNNFVTEMGGVCSASGVFAYCVARMEVDKQAQLYNQLAKELAEAGVKIVDGRAIMPTAA